MSIGNAIISMYKIYNKYRIHKRACPQDEKILYDTCLTIVVQKIEMFHKMFNSQCIILEECIFPVSFRCKIKYQNLYMTMQTQSHKDIMVCNSANDNN